MSVFISHSPEETQAFGKSWGRTATSGMVLGLTGELGAGKTQLVKGLARGLGINESVHSPSFALVNVYSGGRFPLFHLDLYRLDTAAQIRAAGLEEYLQPAGITVIEWVERWFPQLSPESKVQSPKSSAPVDLGHWTLDSGLFCHIRIESVSETERRIIYEAPGS